MPYNPISLRNLKPPWQPGQSGNPKGRAVGCYGAKRRCIEGLRTALKMDRRQAAEKAEPVKVLTEEEVMAMVDAMGPRITCFACSHGQREAIDGLLTLGIPVRSLAGTFGISKSALFRHKQHHLPAFPQTEAAQEVVKVEEMLKAPIYFLRRAEQLYSGRLHECAWKVSRMIWEALEKTFDTGPIGRFQYHGVVAAVHLAYIGARDRWETEQNQKDIQTALQVLEAWGRDHGDDEPGGSGCK